MSSGFFQSIKSQQDVDIFDDLSNGLHDGYITRVEYDNAGVISADEGGLFFDYSRRTLLLHILVTSLKGHPIFELRFSGVVEYQIRDVQFNDMIGFSVLFQDNGLILWADDCFAPVSELKMGTYVIAQSMEYRML